MYFWFVIFVDICSGTSFLENIVNLEAKVVYMVRDKSIDLSRILHGCMHICDFFNKDHLDKQIEEKLRELWKNKLVLKDEFAIRSIDCEWIKCFYPKSKSKSKNQKGGNMSDIYCYKYNKYKTKYLSLK